MSCQLTCAKGTPAGRGYNSPFCCRNCIIFWHACGKVFNRRSEKIGMPPGGGLPAHWGLPPGGGLPAHWGLPPGGGLPARWGFHWTAGGTRTPGTPRTPKTWQVPGAKHLPFARLIPQREAPQMRRPGCLGCPGCPGQAPIPRSGPRLPSPQPAHCRLKVA